MATKKKVVKAKAKKAKPNLVKSDTATKKETLWEVRMRGFRSEPRLRVIVDATTDEDAKAKAKSAVITAGITEKPVVHAAIKHADWYRIFAPKRDSFFIVREINVWDVVKKGFGSRDDDDFKNEVGWVSVELHTVDTGGDYYVEPSCGIIYISWDAKGLYGSYVDDDLYQQPPKVFYARLNFEIDGIIGEMKKALKKEKGIKL